MIRACSVLKKPIAEELVQQAYVIVHVKAVDYEERSYHSYWSTDITPSSSSSIIRFQVEEIIKGIRNIPNPLLINGYLSQYDDFNDHSSPYDFVRPDGRSGSCFATTYKQNGDFLLFLNNQYTPYWAALSPVNEQLRSPPYADAWLQWVTKRVAIDSNEQSTGQSITNDATKLRSFFF